MYRVGIVAFCLLFSCQAKAPEPAQAQGAQAPEAAAREAEPPAMGQPAPPTARPMVPEPSAPPVQPDLPEQRPPRPASAPPLAAAEMQPPLPPPVRMERQMPAPQTDAALPAQVRPPLIAFLQARPDELVFPTDPSLGPLADLLPPKEGNSPIVAAVAFIRAFMDKRLDETLLGEERAMILGLRLSRELAVSPRMESFRLGAFHKLGEGQGSLNLRVSTKTGDAEGELILESLGGDWRVVDITLDLADLSLPRKARDRLDPQDYPEGP